MERNHYILFVDDSGSRYPDHTIVSGKELDCFALGGVLIHEKDIPLILNQYKNFCLKWNIKAPLHSYEIRNATDNFAWIGKSHESKEKFWSEVGQFLVNLPVLGFAAVVDRVGYNSKFKDVYENQRWMMCKTAFAVLVERAAKYVTDQNATFEIFFEGSTAKENNLLVSYGKAFKEVGLPFSSNTSAKYRPLDASDFKKVLLGKPRRGYKSNPLLQIADMYLFPMIARKYLGVEYLPWKAAFDNKRVIDAVVAEEQWGELGIKYSCFQV